MKKLYVICFFIFFTAFAEEQNRFKVFEDETVPYKEKILLAKNPNAVNEVEYKYLISLIDKFNTESFLATIALKKLRLKKSVKPIAETLLKVNDRYLALTLGAMGYKEAIPYLRQAIKQNEEKTHNGMDNPVIENSYIALRMLGAKCDKVEKLPSMTKNMELSIELESSSQDIYPGQKAIFKITFKNNGSKPLRIDPLLLLLAGNLKLSSPEKEIIIQRKILIPSEKNSDMLDKIFPVLDPGEKYIKNYEYVLKIQSPKRLEWPNIKPYKLLILNIEAAMCYELCVYKKGKVCPVDFVYVYKTKYGNERLKDMLKFIEKTKPEVYEKIHKEALKIPVYTDEVVSNAVRVRFHADKK